MSSDAAAAAASASVQPPPAKKSCALVVGQESDQHHHQSANTELPAKQQQQQQQEQRRHDFGHFCLREVLDSSQKAKFVALLGHFSSAATASSVSPGDATAEAAAAAEGEEGGKPAEAAVLLLEKEAFPTEQLLSSCDSRLMALFDAASPPDVVMHNDVWHKYRLRLAPELCSAKATLIHPATDRLVAKYRRRPVHLVVETPDDYRCRTEPALSASGAQHSLAWVANILDGSAERDRLVHSDPDPAVGFVLHADLKWDGRRMDDLYCLAVCRRPGLHSLRQLDDSHLPLLVNLLDAGRAAVSARYGVPASQLRVFLHYQPSFYHLHAHFTHVAADWPGQQAERAHLLSSVIGNIRLMPDYYQRAALTFPVKEGDPLFAAYKDRLV